MSDPILVGEDSSGDKEFDDFSTEIASITCCPVVFGRGPNKDEFNYKYEPQP